LSARPAAWRSRENAYPRMLETVGLTARLKEGINASRASSRVSRSWPRRARNAPAVQQRMRNAILQAFSPSSFS
jgi:hypothetical protein